MFPFTALRPLDSQPDLGKPHQTSELACVQFGLIPWCAGQHCVSPWPDLLSLRAAALSQLLWLPRPSSGVLAYLKLYPGQLWAPHSSHTTLYYWANQPKYSPSPAKKTLLLLLGLLKNNKENMNCKFIGQCGICVIFIRQMDSGK